MHVVTPGVNTDMLDETDEQYGRYADTSSWDRIEPAAWAAKIVGAMESGDHILGPGGKTALAKLASRGPAFGARRRGRADVQPAAAIVVAIGGGAVTPARTLPRHAGLASTACTTPIRRSAKPASQ